jgi:hypothetical protein
MPRELSKAPVDRLGVYKRYEEVPERYRLHQYAGEYRDRDVWQEFVEAELLAEERTDRYEQDVRRAGESWQQHLDSRGRHPALATPADVETWCESLLEERNAETVYLNYWVKIQQFYDWLLYHPAHPHVYNPVVMAAVTGECASRVWTEKVNRGKKYD